VDPWLRNTALIQYLTDSFHSLFMPDSKVIVKHSTPALGKTSIAVHQWTAKQFWVDRQSFKKEDDIYSLVKVQIN
jgi:hypothetical protein